LLSYLVEALDMPRRFRCPMIAAAMLSVLLGCEQSKPSEENTGRQAEATPALPKADSGGPVAEPVKPETRPDPKPEQRPEPKPAPVTADDPPPLPPVTLEEEWRAFARLRGARPDTLNKNLHIRSLEISGKDVDDASLSNLRKLQHLQKLKLFDLDPDKVTD